MRKLISVSTALLGALAIGGTSLTASAETVTPTQRHGQTFKSTQQRSQNKSAQSSSLQDSDLQSTTLSACTVKSNFASGTATPGSIITIKTASGHVAGTAYASSILGVWWTNLDTKYTSGTQFTVTVSKSGYNSLTRTIEINS